MKKTLFLTLLFAGLSLTPANAAPYVSGTIGYGISGDLVYDNGLREGMDSGVALNGAVGYKFGEVRTEAAIGYQQHAFSDDTFNVNPQLSVLTVMGNGYYDFAAGSGVKPYVMAGAGIANVHYSNDFVDGSTNTHFAWQLGAGVACKVSDNVLVDVGYRYLRPTGVHDNSNNDLSWTIHNVMAGFRYEF
ncbi:MAG: porin family protein [Chlorobiaceae bacterium]|nr:porin family protein [Chlorobiaceae bacterium]